MGPIQQGRWDPPAKNEADGPTPDGRRIHRWPLRELDGRTRGTTPLPVPNIPNREGVDPHGPDASETDYGLDQIAAFLSPAEHVIAVCGDDPCYLDGWTGPGR